MSKTEMGTTYLYTKLNQKNSLVYEEKIMSVRELKNGGVEFAPR